MRQYADVDTREDSMTTLDPMDEIRAVAVQYENYLALSRVADVSVLETASSLEFYEPRSAPLTVTISQR